MQQIFSLRPIMISGLRSGQKTVGLIMRAGSFWVPSIGAIHQRMKNPGWLTQQKKTKKQLVSWRRRPVPHQGLLPQSPGSSPNHGGFSLGKGPESDLTFGWTGPGRSCQMTDRTWSTSRPAGSTQDQNSALAVVTECSLVGRIETVSNIVSEQNMIKHNSMYLYICTYDICDMYHIFIYDICIMHLNSSNTASFEDIIAYELQFSWCVHQKFLDTVWFLLLGGSSHSVSGLVHPSYLRGRLAPTKIPWSNHQGQAPQPRWPWLVHQVVETKKMWDITVD